MAQNEPHDPERTRPLDPPPGPVFGDRFRVRQMLGTGAMGDVYLAEDLKLQRRVAIKCIRAEHRASEVLLQRIKRECLLHARIGAHPNIVTLYDIIDSGDQLLIVMEYVEGEALDKALSRLTHSARPMPPERCVEIVIQCLEALAHTHRHGIIHRDIKPANVILDRKAPGRRSAKLMDFGIARLEDEDPNATTLTQPGSRSPGTPLYMAPEQIDSAAYGPVTPAADIYAVGVMLYHMISGRPPFLGTMTDIFNGHLNFTPKPCATVSGDPLDPVLWGAIERAMAKRPADRFASAEDFADMLRGYLTMRRASGSYAGGATEFDEPPRRTKSFRRKSAAGWIAPVAAVLVAVAIGGGLYLRAPGRQDAETRQAALPPALPQADPREAGPSNAPEPEQAETSPSSAPEPEPEPVRPVAPLEYTVPAGPEASAIPATAPAESPPEPTPAPLPEIIPPAPAANAGATEPPLPRLEETAAPVLDEFHAFPAVTEAADAPMVIVTEASELPPASGPVALWDDPVVFDPLEGAGGFGDAGAPGMETGDPGPAAELETVAARGEVTVIPPASETTPPAPAAGVEARPIPDPDGGAGADTAQPRVHVVQAGETLRTIASRYGLTSEDLARWNQLRDPNSLFVGQELYLYERPGLESREAPGAEAPDEDRGSPGQVFKEDLKDVFDKTKQGIRNLGRKVRNAGK